MKNLRHRDTCRLCGSRSLELVLPILPSPIGDAFVPESMLNEQQDLYPLDAYLCLDCGHLQNLDMVNPDILFRQYTYRTSSSLGLVEHFSKYAKVVVEALKPAPDSLVVEIGSNDGSLLKAFKQHGLRVVGVDPARAIAAVATSEGVPTIDEFFDYTIAQKVLDEHGHAALVCANNVFAHADNIADIVKGIRLVLAPDGAFVFEVSYVPDMIDNLVFDTIYHEHVSYHALIPLEHFFNGLDMTLFDAERSPTKGGSIRGFAQPLSTGTRARTERLLALMEEERRRKITEPEIYRAYFAAIEDRKRKTLGYVRQAITEGKTVAAYGASTTTTTLLYHFELEDKIAFIADDNPIKQGTFSPRAHVPVLPSSALYERRPDVVVILAWIYAGPIIGKHQEYVDKGGVFLTPLPDMKITKS